MVANVRPRYRRPLRDAQEGEAQDCTDESRGSCFPSGSTTSRRASSLKKELLKIVNSGTSQY